MHFDHSINTKTSNDLLYFLSFKSGSVSRISMFFQSLISCQVKVKVQGQTHIMVDATKITACQRSHDPFKGPSSV